MKISFQTDYTKKLQNIILPKVRLVFTQTNPIVKLFRITSIPKPPCPTAPSKN